MKPLVLLDVDGVVNDLTHWTQAEMAEMGMTTFVSNGYTIRMPKYMPELVQSLVDNCEVHWCSTWRERANLDIAGMLGIPHLPVVTDGTDQRVTSWKHGAATPLVLEALGQGRKVYWIEDFYGKLPPMPKGTVFVDTASDSWSPVLRPEDLPMGLRFEKELLP